MSTCDLETIQHIQSHIGVFHTRNLFELLAYTELAYEEQRPEIIECPMCLNFIGIGYTYGEGLVQDIGKGLALLKKASDLGLAKASWNLYLIYREGQVVEQDLEISLAYCEKAAELGDQEAMENLQEMRDLVCSNEIVDLAKARFKPKAEE